jgi:putative spermidine/putrescine transport system ATP-binding protein
MNSFPGDTASTLVLRTLTKRYGSSLAVDNLDLTIEAGKLVSLLGPSGCGKTTTLRMVAGFERPDAGIIQIGATNVTALPPHQRQLGMVFQNYSLFPHRTVAENIGFGLKMQGLGRGARDERVKSMLDLIQLSGRGDTYPAKLSGGQQQRVALARSLVVNPKILLLDEPLSALDKSLRESMQFEIRAMQARLGITTLLVTHDQEEALSMADQVAVMKSGRILQLGTPGDIYDRPQSRFVAEFLGASNIFEDIWRWYSTSHTRPPELNSYPSGNPAANRKTTDAIHSSRTHRARREGRRNTGRTCRWRCFPWQLRRISDRNSRAGS